MSAPPLRLFSLSTCYHCKTLRKMLEKYAVPFEFLELDEMSEEKRDAALAELQSRVGDRPVFPTLFIGDAVVEGGDRRAVLDALESQGVLTLSFLEKVMAKIAGDR